MLWENKQPNRRGCSIEKRKNKGGETKINCTFRRRHDWTLPPSTPTNIPEHERGGNLLGRSFLLFNKGKVLGRGNLPDEAVKAVAHSEGGG